jgi:tripartite ATP-independent transporter DctM subunit
MIEMFASIPPIWLGIIAMSLMLLLIVLGQRIYVAGGVIGFGGLVSVLGWDAGSGIAGIVPHTSSASYALSVIPMFLLIGFLAFHAKITHAVFDAARKWFSWLPGSLAIATVFASAGYGAVSGASTATAAVFARMAIPEMLKYGYSPRLAAGVVAAGGTLATLIPPSAMLIIYAIIVEESVGKLLVAGFIPGIVSAIIYALLISGMVKLNPELAPPAPSFTWSERIKTLPPNIPVIAVVLIIFTAMYTGWATPTEAGALGSFIIFSLAIYRGMGWKSLKEALNETVTLTVMMFAIYWGVKIFSRYLGFAGIPEAFATSITSFDVSPMSIIIIILLTYMVLGMFMDALSMLLLTLPVVYPAVMLLGFDSVWFGIVLIKMVEIGLITPPIGFNCYIVHGVRPDIPVPRHNCIIT